MKNYIIGLVILAVVLIVGLGYSLSHKNSTLGGTVENFPVWFYNGLSAGNTSTTGNSGSLFSVSSAGIVTEAGEINNGSQTAATYKTATVGISSSSPAVLGSAAAGHVIVASGATTLSASTTAVTANSDIQLSLEQTTPIAGTTCNTAINASSTYAIVTKVPGNGFTATIAGAPITNPFCYSYSITN